MRKRLAWLGLVLLAFALLAAPSGAQSLPGMPGMPGMPGPDRSSGPEGPDRPGGPAPAGGVVGSLSGRVTSYGGRGLVGARVQLDTGQVTVSGADGSFRMDGVPAGSHGVTIQCSSYRSASGQVTVVGGETRSLLVELRRLNSGGGGGAKSGAGRTGTLWIEAYTRTGYRGGRMWIAKIEVWEYGRASRTWYNSWWSDTGDTYRSLSCPGARLNRDYEIAVTWKGRGNYSKRTVFYKKFWTPGQVERFYHP